MRGLCWQLVLRQEIKAAARDGSIKEKEISKEEMEENVPWASQLHCSLSLSLPAWNIF